MLNLDALSLAIEKREAYNFLMLKKKIITIEDLAGMVMRGFKEMNESIDARFDEISSTMATKKDIQLMEKRLDRHELASRKTERTVEDDHGPRIANLEVAVGI